MNKLTRYSPERGIRIRKVAAHISFTRRTEQGIADGMQQDVCIRMADKTPFMGDFNSPQNQPVSFLKRMDIIPYTGCISHLLPLSVFSPEDSSVFRDFKIISASGRSSGRVILMLSQAPGRTRTQWPRRSTSAESSV